MKEKIIDGNVMTVTGKTLGENVERWTHKHGELDFTHQDVIRPLSKPIKATGHIRYACPRLKPIPADLWCSRERRSDDSPCRILKGNLAPGSAVSKITGKEGLKFVGKAKCFDSEDEMVKAVERGSIKKGEKTVVVLRYLGPKGGPGEH